MGEKIFNQLTCWHVFGCFENKFIAVGFRRTQYPYVPLIKFDIVFVRYIQCWNEGTSYCQAFFAIKFEHMCPGYIIRVSFWRIYTIFTLVCISLHNFRRAFRSSSECHQLDEACFLATLRKSIGSWICR